MQNLFTSRDVIALTGITARQLQWWDERRIVVPARQGHRRLYSMEDLAEIAVICELRRRGFSLQRVRKVMRFLQREFSKRLAETVSGASEYHLLTDGRTIYLETSAKQILDILKNARRMGEKEDPYWAVLSCPKCGTLGLITRKQLAGLLPVICGSDKCSAQFFINDSDIVVRKPC